MSNEVTHKLEVPVIEWSFKGLKEGQSIKIPGFKTEWMQFGNEDIMATVYSGAGMGNKWMEISVEETDKKDKRYFKIDASKIAQAILDIVDAEKAYVEDAHNW
jgi:hypothetical protein